MYFWVCQMLLTNCYVVYKKYMILHNKKPLSQYQFKYQVCLCWLDPSHRPQLGKRRRIQDQTACVKSVVAGQTLLDDISEITVSTRSSSGLTKSPPSRATRFSDKTLDPIKGSLKMRLDCTVEHWPTLQISEDSRCQMHAWATGGSKYQCNIVYCQVCNAHLCLQCYRIFHCIPDLVGMKETLCLSYGGSVIVEDTAKEKNA